MMRIAATWVNCLLITESLKAMQNVCVQFTVPNVDKVINLEVHVNGENRKLKFRVEKFDFDSDNGSAEDLVTILRDRITNYDAKWEIYHIGTPAEGKIPVTFRFKNIH